MANIHQSYIGKRANTPEFKFQELCRKKFMLYDCKEDVTSGWHALCLMLSAINIPIDIPTEKIKTFIDNHNKDIQDIASELSNTYISFVKNDIILKIPKYPTNVRDLVTLMLIYPKKINEFEEWKKTKISLSHLEFDFSTFKFAQHSKGGALGYLSDEVNIADEIWNQKDKWFDALKKDNEHYKFDELKIIKMNAHITVLNSYIVSKNKELVDELCAKYNSMQDGKEIILEK